MRTANSVALFNELKAQLLAAPTMPPKNSTSYALAQSDILWYAMARIPWSRAFGVDEAVLAKSLDDIEVAEQRDERALS